MAVVTKFKYIGVELHGDQDITAAPAHRHSRMVAAQAAVNHSLKELRIPYDPMVATCLFAAITAAMGSYGCKVWSTRYLGNWSLHADQCQLQSYQAVVYKHSLASAQVSCQPADLSGQSERAGPQPIRRRLCRLCGCGPGLQPHQDLGHTAAHRTAVCVPRPRLNCTHAAAQADQDGADCGCSRDNPLLQPAAHLLRSMDADNCIKRQFCKNATHEVGGRGS
jgi:hypothetical protein